MNSHLAQPHILEQHRIPLETVVNAGLGGQSALLAKLYAYAWKVALAPGVKADPGDKIHFIRRADGRAKSSLLDLTATAIDCDSGIFVTLCGLASFKGIAEWVDAPLLTVGKTLAQEIKSAQLSNTAVKFW